MIIPTLCRAGAVALLACGAVFAQTATSIAMTAQPETIGLGFPLTMQATVYPCSTKR